MSMVATASAFVVTLLALAASDPARPVCAVASHDRLIVRVDRDVCAATLSRSGRPIAIGFMPTRCTDPAREYRIDAAGNADRCVIAAASK